MNRFIGIGLIIISAMSFGAMAILAKYAYASGISTQSLLFLRFIIAAAFMLPIAVIQKRIFPKGKDLLILIGMGMIGYAGQSYCFFTALTLIPPSLTAILLYLYPVFVAILSVFFLNEQFSKRKITALILAISGVFLVIGIETNANITGILFGVSAAIIYSIYSIVGAKVMSRNDAFTSTIIIIGSAALFYLTYNIRTGFFFPPTPADWGFVISIALISTVVAIYTYFQGMKIIGAVNASMLSTFEPVTTMVLSALFLNMTIGPLQTAGAILILSSAVLVASKKQTNKHLS